MRINQVVLVPSFHTISGEGQISGRFSEREAVHGYMESTYEHLEEDRVIVKIHDNTDVILPNTLLIHCYLGWERPQSKAKYNIATIGYIQTEVVPLAMLLCESLSEWGRSYVDYHHKTANPRLEESLPLSDTQSTMSIVLRPFKLNGAESTVYMKNLETLGRTIAYCVNEFLLIRGEQGKLA